MQNEKVLIGMSGGVDSTVAAYLMQKSGRTCVGATMQLCTPALLGQNQSCGSLSGCQDAKAAADLLGIPFHIFDGTKHFEEQVVGPFVNAYKEGLTPNPCILCNCHLKFSYMLEVALSLGCNYVATGHYARVRYCENTGRYQLCKAVDAVKDQSYFLAGLTQEQLSHIQFPLGNLSKEQVRQIAQEQGFQNARKQDSQDICFIPDGDCRTFLARYGRMQFCPGNFLDLEGNVLGRHTGSIGYTIGQRKGLGLAVGQPVYVCGTDPVHNTVTVGPDSALYRAKLIADNINWVSICTPDEPLQVMAKLRSRHTEQPATVYPLPGNRFRVEFETPQRAITPGQMVVLYDGDLVLGSGIIKEVI